jgi:hypothetical protein
VVLAQTVPGSVIQAWIKLRPVLKTGVSAELIRKCHWSPLGDE